MNIYPTCKWFMLVSATKINLVEKWFDPEFKKSSMMDMEKSDQPCTICPGWSGLLVAANYIGQYTAMRKISLVVCEVRIIAIHCLNSLPVITKLSKFVLVGLLKLSRLVQVLPGHNPQTLGIVPREDSNQPAKLLFDLILYVPVNNFSVMLGWVFLGWTSTKQGFMCPAQGQNTCDASEAPTANPQSQVKHSTTEPLRFKPAKQKWHWPYHNMVCWKVPFPQGGFIITSKFLSSS